MNNLKKMVLILVNIVAISLFLHSAELPPKTWARMDVVGIKEHIKLTPIKEELSKGVTFLNQHWRKEKDFCLFSRIFFKKDVWRHVKLAFKGDKSGKVRLGFNGAYRPKKEFEKLGYPSFKYCNIKVNGEAVNLDDEGWILKNKAEIIKSKDGSGKDKKCIKAKCISPAYYNINIVKDKPVAVEFDVKFVE